MSRPYLIVPQLIEQPTWGGDYIVGLKGWKNRKGLGKKKIGQSYELSGSSLLATNIISSDDKGLYKPNTTTPLESVLEKDESMPLLIKLNQARGNSFQLHITPRDNNSAWKPKPESWYFLEKGYISLGLNPQTSIKEYQKTCEIIERCMIDLSQQVKDKVLDLSKARKLAHAFIKEQDPWQFVNRYEVDQFDLIDLSMGGIHHSWEENGENTIGNVVYEVQLDVTDDESTMRSFDQGKIKDDASIRPITIDDYFAHIDTNPKHNTLEYLKRTSDANTLLKTDYYVLERFEISGKHPQKNGWIMASCVCTGWKYKAYWGSQNTSCDQGSFVLYSIKRRTLCCIFKRSNNISYSFARIMKFSYQKTSRVDERELTKTIESLSDYQTHLKDVVSKSGYDSDEASINLPSDKGLIQRVMQMTGKKKSENLKYIVVIGIGGSNLGTKAIYDALYGYYDVMRNDRFPKMIFLDTQDADVLSNLSSLLSSIVDQDEILINAISKSGGTTETMANFEVVFGMLKDHFPTIADQIVFTTNEDSKFDEAGKNNDIDVLHLPEKVGGRYSIFSAVGLFPLAVLGIDIEELMTSAVNMRELCVNSQGLENPALVSAGILFTQSQQGKNINDNFIFAPQLESMGKWYRQLMGESIGKDGKGITPTVSIGSTDLHSVGQLYLGGPKDKTTTFIYTKTSRGTVLVPQTTHLGLVAMIAGKSISSIMQAIVQGTKRAYEKQELPYMEIELDSISVAEIATFMQFKMIEMMYLGKLMGVNTFDQPHVELYKTETKRILEEADKETEEIMADPTLMAAIREGEAEIKAGKGIPWEEVKKE